MGGIEVGVVGRLARREASILFCSQSLDLPAEEDVEPVDDVGGGIESMSESRGRLAPG